MTELERRALLGDRKAQEECTEKGIILPCPLCGGQADKVVYDSAGLYVCKRCKIYKPFTIVVDGARKALAVWNTRSMPTVDPEKLPIVQQLRAEIKELNSEIIQYRDELKQTNTALNSAAKWYLLRSE